MEAIIGRRWPGLVVAANDIGVHWPHHIDHWATLHASKMETTPNAIGWIEERVGRGGNIPTIWCRPGQGLHGRARVLRPWAIGSSGMFAMQVAIAVGAKRVVLCGVPMTRTPHFAESTVHVATRQWRQVDIHWKHWPEQADKFRAQTRSMSGRTRDLLGAPTLAWLTGEQQ